MDYLKFVEAFKGVLQRKYGEQYELSYVTKNNNHRKVGVSKISKGAGTSPVIYLEDYYNYFNKGEKLEDLVVRLVATIERLLIENEVSIFNIVYDYEKIKEKIVYMLVNKEMNNESLIEFPYTEFLDMIRIYKVVIEMDDGNVYSMKITNRLMKLWGISLEELDRMARENTPTLLPVYKRTMKEVIDSIIVEKLTYDKSLTDEEIRELICELGVVDNFDMYVISNNKMVNGAGAVFYDGVLEKIAEEWKSDVYILPSSIHETILVRADDNNDRSVSELQYIVSTINTNEVEAEEVLSDNVYYYEMSTGRVLIA